MKHVFVVNPCAGKRDSGGDIAADIDMAELDAELYETRCQRDATRFVADWCRQHPGEAVRFYACGGDGTLNEVVSGVMSVEGGERKVEVGCFPCGSGNDYVKYFEGRRFDDVRALAEGDAVEVDVMEFEVAGERRYCINTLNFGFEAEVCRTMADVRRKPLIGGRMAYTTGIVKSLATGRKNPCRIEVDAQPWYEGDLLLASLANGRYAGGGFMCAPRSVNDDGLLEVMYVKPLSVAQFVKLIKYYEHGEHLDRPELHEVVGYCRGTRVCFSSDEPFYIAIDGELVRGTRFEVMNHRRALRFVVPSNR